LSKKEKLLFFFFASVTLISLVFLIRQFYFTHTIILPDFGGSYKEGILGRPQFINPLYLASSDADRDIIEILFGALLKISPEGNFANQLAKTYKIEENGRVYKFEIRDDALWEDGEAITSDDIVFTTNLVQNPQYHSPLFKEWLGIKTEKEGDKKVKFILEKPYFPFLETISRLKILPKHLFQNISPENFLWKILSEDLLKGSGPFSLKKIYRNKKGQIEKIVFQRNNKYFQKPFLKEISFHFYDKPEQLIESAKKNEIDGFVLPDLQLLKNFEKIGFKPYHLSLPRYFAVFFNLKEPSSILKNKQIRKALALSIDKKEILEKIFNRYGKIVNSPVLPNYYNLNQPSKIYDFQPQKAKEILEKEGFHINPNTGYREKTIITPPSFLFKRDLKYGDKGEEVRKLQECLAKDPQIYPQKQITGYFGTKTKNAVIKFQQKYKEEILQPIGLQKGTGKVGKLTRKKLNEICFPKQKDIIPLKVSLTFVNKFPSKQIAEIIKNQWEKVGVKVEMNQISISDFETKVLKERKFQALVFGECLGFLPDPFPFWHSSQKEYPGLNISYYSSKKADELLEKIRTSFEEKVRKESLEKFQDILLEDLPAIFLVQPDYIYMLSPKIKGFKMKKITEPSKRFSNIEKWYTKTKRVWK